MKFWFTLLLSCAAAVADAQIIIKGRVTDATDNKPIVGAEVNVVRYAAKGITDSIGKFELGVQEAGFYVLEVIKEGYKNAYSAELLFTFDKSPEVNIQLELNVQGMNEVRITKSALQSRRAESPLSAQQLSVREIERNPGGNRDISKIVQSLPGVISIPGFRNDIIIRGGAPVENKFYLDGIEIPQINHFQTQGSTGGAVGLLNVNFIKEVNFYSGAFPINLANGMSAVVDFQQLDGNKDKSKFRFTLGSSDLGFTADGPLGKNKKATYIVSARQSYLQGLFTLLGLPFLPNFIDYQAKVKIELDGKRELTFIMLGAYDFFKLNEKVNEGVTDSLKLKSNKYILGYLPSYNQWNYTVGSVYTQYGKKDKQQWFLSRNMLRNRTFKYRNNDDSDPANKILDYVSTEAENKLRYEYSRKIGKWKTLHGAGVEYAKYDVSTYNVITTPQGISTIDFISDLGLLKYNLFSRFSNNWNGVLFSAGFRLDGSNYNANTANVLNQPGVSISVSVPISDNIYVNANVGQFHQLPGYTVLGYRNNNGELANRDEAKYIRNRMAVAGIQYNQGRETKITIEGFYKQYSRYPFTLRDSISLGNLGADYSVVGNEAVNSQGRGEAYGLEFLAQRRSRNGLYGIVSYTLAWSRFEDKFGKMVASAWDSRHTLSLTAGYKLKKNWEIGAKWRLVTGRPYTPDDVERSLLIANWNLRGQALPDYNQLNSGRLSDFNQFDIRVDKVWYFKRSSLNLYLDIQNLFNSQYTGPNTLTVAQNADGSLQIDPNNSQRYRADFLPNTTGTVLPTIGVILDF